MEVVTGFEQVNQLRKEVAQHIKDAQEALNNAPVDPIIALGLSAEGNPPS